MAKESRERTAGEKHDRAAATSEVDDMDKPQRRRRAVSAGVCPRVPAHGPGRVYKTNNQVRYCVCDQCGDTWKKAGPPASSAEDDDE